jgi:hypothetical protein
MRLPFIGLTIAGVLLGQAAALAATPSCVRPAERSALDVEGLKSELMVIALDCDARDHYNAFVNRYKSTLNSDEKQLGGYFTRAYGRRTNKQDLYNTELANGQSQAGTKQGTLFCQQHMAMFDQVMALRNDAELPEYAAGQDLAQPVSAEVCTTPERPILRVAARRTIRSKHHH